MLATPVSITYDSVAYDFERVNQDNYSADYMSTTVPSGISAMRFSVKHNVPARGGTGEGHVIKLEIDVLDGNDEYLRTESAWMVMKTFENIQVTSSIAKLGSALTGIVPSIQGKVLGRES